MPTTRRGASARRPEAGVENAPAGYGAAGGVSFSSDIPAETGSSTAQDAQPMLALAKSGANVQWIDLGSKAVGEKERGDITHRNKGQEFVVRAREIFACCALHFSWHFWFEYSALQRLMEIQTKTSRRP